MRRGIGRFLGAAGLIGALTLAKGAQAAPPVSAEKGLLGVRILQSYRTVLQKYGTPTRIFRVGELVRIIEAVDAKGNPTGGVRSLGDDATTASAGGAAGGRGPTAGGAPPGAPGMSGGYGGYSGYGGGRPTSGPPPGAGGGYGAGYAAQYGAGAGGGRSGGASSPRMSGGGDRGGLPGGMGGSPPSGSGDGQTFQQAGGFIWVYFYPKKELLYAFVFNSDGRVEVILERGRNLGQATRRGVGLGSALQAVYSIYGWPNSTEQEGNGLGLYYNQNYHAQFATFNSKVIGVAVCLRESQKISLIDRSGQNGGGGGGYGAGKGAASAGGGGAKGGGAAPGVSE